MRPERASEKNSVRDKSGRFVKGMTGNPGGRAKDDSDIRALARNYAKPALMTLVTLMYRSPNHRVRQAAAEALLNRGYGKPHSPGDGNGRPTVTVNIGDMTGMTPAQVYEHQVQNPQMPQDQFVNLIRHGTPSRALPSRPDVVDIPAQPQAAEPPEDPRTAPVDGTAKLRQTWEAL